MDRQCKAVNTISPIPAPGAVPVRRQPSVPQLITVLKNLDKAKSQVNYLERSLSISKERCNSMHNYLKEHGEGLERELDSLLETIREIRLR